MASERRHERPVNSATEARPRKWAALDEDAPSQQPSNERVADGPLMTFLRKLGMLLSLSPRWPGHR